MGLEQVRVRLLGALDIDGVDTRALGSRKARTLVKVRARPVEQVGVLVSRLRGILGADRLVRTRARWYLRLDWLDVDELDDRVVDAAARLADGRPSAARAAARAALALVRGELVAGEPAGDGDPVQPGVRGAPVAAPPHSRAGWRRGATSTGAGARCAAGGGTVAGRGHRGRGHPEGPRCRQPA